MPDSSRATKEGEPQEEYSPQPQTPRKVSIDLTWVLLCFVSMVLTFVLQKKHQINYESDDEDLERMMAEVSGGSNHEEGDESDRKPPYHIGTTRVP